jgi:phosphopantothenoylcysteine decarboxylase / phosphopantothenate---cysteine ligase
MLFQKNIVLGITGSIAAYKSALLVRLLHRAGAEVRVVMTNSAKDFVTPLTLSTLSKNKVVSSFTNGDQGEWVNHVELGLWADLMVIAPASANTIGSCANGLCENLLQAVYLSARCPVFFAPAMDLDMWKHPSTQNNIHSLRSNGNHIIEPGTGELASGLIGEGRMAEPEEILHTIEEFFSRQRQMNGKRILITAGPTREAIDPVRYISNHSSGKMGYALADELASRGARVILVSGPVELRPGNQSVQCIKVTNAREMLEVAIREYAECNAAILTAAVADYQPENPSAEKIKKSESALDLKLHRTPDILASLGKMKRTDQFLAGFALETSEGRKHAEQKLENKNLDFIVLNQLSPANQVFGSDNNQIEIFTKEGEWKSYPMQSKKEVSKEIADQLNSCFKHE